jgi:hypothetical protein
MATAIAVAVFAWPAGAGAWRFARHQASAIAFPYPLDYGEGPILDQAVRLGHLENIYPADLSSPPYAVANYPPLHPLLQAPFTRLFGPAYWYGRLLASGGVALAAAGLALVLWALTHDLLASLVAGLVLLSFPHVVDWSRLNRVDGLALGLGTAALSVLVRAPDARRARLAAGLLLTAAIYTRQSHALAAPLAALAWLFATRRRDAALELAAVVAGTCLALFLALQVATGGGFFRHVVTANVNPFFWGRAWPYLREVWTQAPWLVLAALALALAGWRADSSWWLVVPYLAGATVSALTIGKVGSGVNYLYELFAALSLAAGALLARARRRPWARIALLLVVAWQVRALNLWTIAHREEPLRARLAQREEIARVAALVRAAPGPVLADELMGLMPLAGRRVYFQPFEFRLLAYAGRWDEERLARDIEEGRFPLILLYEPPDWDSVAERWSEPLRQAIFHRYRLVDRAADTGIYRPAD